MNGAEQMREIARRIGPLTKGLGFAVVVFEFGKPGIGNYISNAQRSEMIEALRETADRLEKNQTFPTQEEN